MAFDIFWYISNFISLLLTAGFLFVNLTPRFNKYVVLLVTFVPFVFFALAQHFFSETPAAFFRFAAIAYFFLAAIFLYKDKLLARIFISTSVMLINYAVVFILLMVFIAIGFNPYDDIVTYMIALPNLILLTVLYLLFTYVRNKKLGRTVLPKGQMITFIFIPLSQFIIMVAAVMIISYYGWFRNKNTALPFFENPTKWPMIMLCVAAVLCVIADAILYYIMVRSSQNEKLREELRFKDYQNELNLEYYKTAEENSVETRKLRHDLANIIQTAYEIVKNGSEADRTAAEHMLDQLRKEVEDIKIEKFCPNTLVNAIASSKAAECRKQNIAYSFDLRVPSSLGIDEVDICKAYVNIFDNAVNAAAAVEGDRSIKIKSFVDENDGMLYISSENAVAPDYGKKKKDRAGEHGYGLKILGDTAKKYGGQFVTNESDGVFTAVLTMKP